jgi:DMSO/TMAO reductase YedYZ molybdopterin-dependent catalytic subunit
MVGSIRSRLVADDRDGALVALASGGGAVAGSYLVSGSTPGFVVAPASEAVLALTPDVVLTLAIQYLGELGQDLSTVAAVGLTVVAFALVTGLAVRVGPPIGAYLEVPGGGILATGVAHLALAAVLGNDFGAIVAGIAGMLVVAVATPRPDLVPVSLARRRAIRAAGAGAVLAGVAGAVGGRVVESDGEDDDVTAAGPGRGSEVEDSQVRALFEVARERSLDLPGADALVTRLDEFYTVDINSFDPDITPEDWSLTVTGAVEEELELSLSDLESMATEHRFVTLRCVGEPLNGEQMDTALWTGVPVAPILEEAGVGEDCCVMLRAADDYYEEFPRAALEEGFLAFGMNGVDLPRGHGRPVRALIPGHWGEINVKWIDEIEILEEPADGYWEKRGWHGTGPVNTVAKLHSVSRTEDGEIVVGGHAYAGTRGIERVEVSTDGGDSWAEATLSERLPARVPADGETVETDGTAEDAWRHWRHVYEASEPHQVVVRAVDGTGALQPEEEAQAFPSGASGWVTRRVQAD